MSGLVSVVVPCYNHESYVGGLIKSIIDQDYADIELIVIDDGSNDGSVKAIESLVSICEERFIRFELRSRPNKGLTKTLNEALRWCEGEYLVAIASDDLMRPNRIKRQVEIFESKKEEVDCLKAIFSSYTLIDSEGVPFDSVNYRSCSVVTFKNYFGKRWLAAPTALLKLKSVIDVGGYNEDVGYEDLDMWLRLLESGGCFYVSSENLSLYRKHEGSYSDDPAKLYFDALKVYSRYFKNPLFVVVVVKLTLDYFLALIRRL